MKCIICKPRKFKSNYVIELSIKRFKNKYIYYMNSDSTIHNIYFTFDELDFKMRKIFEECNVYVVNIPLKIIKLLFSEDNTIKKMGFDIIFRYPGKLHIKNLNQLNEIFNLEKKDT